MAYGRSVSFDPPAWILGFVGLAGLMGGWLTGPFPFVYGQRGAELGTIMLENDKVVVRRYLLLPGMPTGMHSHNRDYPLVILQGGTVKVTTLSEGTTRTEKVETGSVAWRTKTTHDSKNVGGSPIEALIVEIK
jgi:hypothetical protein